MNKKALVQSQFAASATNYADSPVHAKGTSLQRLVELTAPKPHWQVLDIATGPGHTALAFAPHVASVVASDLTPEMLAVARDLAVQKGITNIQFQIADAEDLMFAADTFDLVTCRIAAHHFPDISAFVGQVRRVLKPGGLFGLVDNLAPDIETTPDHSDVEISAAAAAYNAFEMTRDPGHVRALTMSEWRDAIASADLNIIHSETLGKTMEFEPWAQRVGADDSTIAQLRHGLKNASPALNAFLQPADIQGVLHFTETEGLFIAERGHD